MKDPNETKSLKKDKGEGKLEKFSGPCFSLGFSHNSQGSKNLSQSQSFTEPMTKKKLRDRHYLAKASPRPQSNISNVSPISFAPLSVH